MQCLQSSILFFPMRQFDLPTTQQKLKLWKLPKIEGSIFKYRGPPLWPTNIGERRTTFGKACGLKVRCYGFGSLGWMSSWVCCVLVFSAIYFSICVKKRFKTNWIATENTLGTWGTFQNLMGTHWDLKGNIVGTHWQPGKNEKISFPSPQKYPPPTPTKLKRKKARHHECMLGPSHWLHEISLPKRVHHQFWPGLPNIKQNKSNFFFFFLQWANLIGLSQKKVETTEAPCGKMECLPLWPTYIGEKGRTLGKNIRD